MFCLLTIAGRATAWDAHGHVLVTQLAIRTLPPDFPAWVTTPENRARLCYLCNEPDRWRGLKSPYLDHVNGPDHYIDVEDLATFGLSLQSLPRFRNQFVEVLTARRIAAPGRFPTSAPEKDTSHTASVPGLLPYAIDGLYWKIASSWSTLATYEEFPDVVTPDELSAARDSIIFHMGLLSHFVGDAGQPLHLTRHHHGWKGPNPNGYTTRASFHQYIDGEVLTLHHLTFDLLAPDARAATGVTPNNPWPDVANMLNATFARVEPLYSLERSGDLARKPGRQFISTCLLDAGGNLAGLWVAARAARVRDDYIAKHLAARRGGPTTSQPTSAATTAATAGLGG